MSKPAIDKRLRKHPENIEIARAVLPAKRVVTKTIGIAKPRKTGPDPDIHNNIPTVNVTAFSKPLGISRESTG